MLDQKLDRQAALHLELGVEPGLRLLQHFGDKVGGDDLDAPAGECPPMSFKIIASEYGSWPVDEAAHQIRNDAPIGARLNQFRDHAVLEVVERGLVAEEEGLVGGHRLDDVVDHRFRSRLHLLNEFADARQARCAPAAAACFPAGTSCPPTASGPIVPSRVFCRYS